MRGGSGGNSAYRFAEGTLKVYLSLSGDNKPGAVEYAVKSHGFQHCGNTGTYARVKQRKQREGESAARADTGDIRCVAGYYGEL